MMVVVFVVLTLVVIVSLFVFVKCLVYLTASSTQRLSLRATGAVRSQLWVMAKKFISRTFSSRFLRSYEKPSTVKFMA